MCSAPVVNTVARVTSGVLTLGTSEIARNNLPKNNVINQVLQTPGNIVTGGQSDNGLITAAKNAILPKPPSFPAPAAPEPGTGDTTDQPPTPGAPAPGTTSVDSLALKRRKKLSALQAGLASTIATSPTGLLGTPSLNGPSAGGLKLKLGA